MIAPFEFFKPEDFYTDGLMQLVFCHSERAITCVDAAQKANAKIKQWLSEAPIVFSYGDQNEWRKEDWRWRDFSSQDKCVSARLVYVEEYKPKECDHKPIHELKTKMSDMVRYAVGLGEDVPCAFCGVKLRATWSPA